MLGGSRLSNAVANVFVTGCWVVVWVRCWGVESKLIHQLAQALTGSVNDSFQLSVEVDEDEVPALLFKFWLDDLLPYWYEDDGDG